MNLMNLQSFQCLTKRAVIDSVIDLAIIIASLFIIDCLCSTSKYFNCLIAGLAD